MQEGFSLEDVNVPRRILETSTPFGKLEETYIRSAVENFKKSLAVGTDRKVK